MNGGKRKYEPEVVMTKKKLKTKPVLGQDGFGEQDSLSCLPDLCLLEVFKHLPRLDLHHTTMSNKRLRPFYHDRSLNSIKWEGGDLSIFQTEEGYGFTLDYCDNYPLKDYYWIHKDYWLSFKYEIVKMNNRPFEESRRVEGLYYDKRRNQTYGRHKWYFPDQFFDALAEITVHHGVKTVLIKQNSFDAVLFDKLNVSLAGHNIETLRCYFASKELITDTNMSFAKFVKNIDYIDLQKSHQTKSLINEEFIHEMGKSEQRGRKLLTSLHMLDFQNRFNPDESILPIIIRFKSFAVATMVLNANWVAKLCMLYLDTTDRKLSNNGSWTFTIDQDLTPQMISQQIRSTNYKYETRYDGYSIVGKNNGFSANIKISFYSTRTIRLVEVTFSSM